VNLKIKTFVAVVILTQGCATVHNGRHQEIRVVTDPAGAIVEVRCGKQQPAAVTPTTVRLPRRVEPCSLILTRPGFHSETVVFDSSLSGWAWGNFAAPVAGAASGTTRQSDQAFVDFFLGALLGGAGFGIDALTGAMWQLEPAKVGRKLAPKSAPNPASPSCESSPVTLRLKCLSPAVGAVPVWMTPGGCWCGERPLKTAWAVDRRYPGALEIQGADLRTGAAVHFPGFDDDRATSFVVRDVSQSNAIPGGIDADEFAAYTFHNGYVSYPRPGCYQFVARLAGEVVRITIYQPLCPQCALEVPPPRQ